MSALSPSPFPPRPNELQLSAALRAILNSAQPEHPLTLSHVIASTGERAFGVLMAFLCLPFLLPIPLPGLSIPFGIALLLLGAQIAVRKHKPWLPGWLLRRKLPPKFTARFLTFLGRIFRPLEKIIKPRLLFMQGPLAMVLVGIALCVDALLLTILPAFPGSNLVPAWMALIKILGITEEDGVLLIAGCVISLGGIVGLIFAVMEGWARLAAHF